MKNLIVISLLILGISFSSFAQPSKRATALNYLKYGELDNAKKSIDACILHPKTSKDARTWWYRGQIYQAINSDDNEKYRNLDLDAVDVAFLAYKKALLYNVKLEGYSELDIENNYEDQIKFMKLFTDINIEKNLVETSILIDILTVRYPALANVMVNRGVVQFQNKDFSKASKSFEGSLFVSGMTGKVDTAIIYYSALSAEKAKNYKLAKEHFRQLIKLEYGADDKEKATMYYFLANIFLSEKDTAKYVRNLEKGIEKYPNESLLLVQLINFKISDGKAEEAKGMIIRAIESDPDNPLLHFNLGTIYEGENDTENAIKSYTKAIEVNPNHLSANYNLGALYNNSAKEIYDKAQNESDNKKYDIIIAEYEATLKKAKPYLEKAHNLDPNDIATMQSLKIIYYKTGEMEKYEALDKLLKEKTQ